MSLEKNSSGLMKKQSLSSQPTESKIYEHHATEFDSGYNLDFETLKSTQHEQPLSPLDDIEIGDSDTKKTKPFLPPFQHQRPMTQDKKSFDSIPHPQEWTDSGVCITDSGLSINEDENDELIDSKDETDSKAKNIDETLLHLAIIEGLETAAYSIIQKITDLEILNSYNYLYQNPLHLAVLKRQPSVIELLIQKGVSLTLQDNLGNTPLHIACKYSLFDIVGLILSTAHHKNIIQCFDIRNYDGDTCLHLAAYNNDLKLLECLLHSGANIDIQEGKSGKTILHWAFENLNPQLVHFLYKYKANIQTETFAGKTPLHFLLKISMKTTSNPTPITSNATTTASLQPQSALNAKINRIIRMSLEYCKEQKLSLESINSSVSDEESSEEEI